MSKRAWVPIHTLYVTEPTPHEFRDGTREKNIEAEFSNNLVQYILKRKESLES
jgi:hypothetical protein